MYVPTNQRLYQMLGIAAVVEESLGDVAVVKEGSLDGVAAVIEEPLDE